MIGSLYQGIKRRLLARRVVVTRLYCHDLSYIPEIPLASTDAIAPLDPARIETVLEVYPVDLAQDRQRLASGDNCVIGWVGARAAHFNWVRDKGVYPMPGTGRRKAIKAGEFWIFSSRTAEWARGRRLQPAAIAYILRQYRERGYKRAFILVDELNNASIRGIERTGFVLEKRFRGLSINRFIIPLP